MDPVGRHQVFFHRRPKGVVWEVAHDLRLLKGGVAVAEKESSQAVLPYVMKQVNSENQVTIGEDEIELIEHRRLGRARTVIRIRDISRHELVSGPEGDEIFLHRPTGNPLRIGPVTKEVAEQGLALIQELRGRS